MDRLLSTRSTVTHVIHKKFPHIFTLSLKPEVSVCRDLRITTLEPDLERLENKEADIFLCYGRYPKPLLSCSVTNIS